MSRPPVQLPKSGRRKFDVLSQMEQARDQDVKWKEGRVFSLVFYPGEEVLDLLKQAYTMFFSENGLNPSAFPSLRRFETDVVSMTASLLGGDAQTAGTMTSGGTESILMAVKAAREWGFKERGISEPELVVPLTAHPAFDKAAHYFQVKLIKVPARTDYRADVRAMEAAITKRTVMLVGSAPAYPQGVVDPIRDLARLAEHRKILMHVDACVGGFMLPFVRRLGFSIPDFDLSVPGVTSISVDLHKYAYTAKGASVILYRDRALRRNQFFAVTDWPGGMYGSPSFMGTRPGGAIAAAWAVMNYLGEEGYLRIAEDVMGTVGAIRASVADMADIHVQGNPDMSVMALGSVTLDIYSIGDEMGMRGWHMDRQQNPAGLHLTVSHAHALNLTRFLTDLRESVDTVRQRGPGFVVGAATKVVGGLAKVLPQSVFSALMGAYSRFSGAGVPKRSAAMYGMMGSLPNRGDLDELVLDFLDKLTTADKR